VIHDRTSAVQAKTAVSVTELKKVLLSVVCPVVKPANTYSSGIAAKNRAFELRSVPKARKRK